MTGGHAQRRVMGACAGLDPLWVDVLCPHSTHKVFIQSSQREPTWRESATIAAAQPSPSLPLAQARLSSGGYTAGCSGGRGASNLGGMSVSGAFFTPKASYSCTASGMRFVSNCARER